MVEYNSEESFDNNLHGEEFYEGALKNTEGIYENNLGPSGSYVNSHSPPDLRYNIQGSGRRSSGLEDFIRENTELVPSKSEIAPHRPTTIQLLRYESSTNAINHGLIPTSLGMAAVAEDDKQSTSSGEVEPDGKLER